MKYALITLLVLLVVVLGLFIAFAPSGAPEREADFRFISSDTLKAFDPQRSSWLVDFRVLECMFETLVRVTPPDWEIAPATAARWEVSEDGKTYTFHLREDAKWSNGDAVTAGDFKYAWRRALMPDVAADYVEMLWNIKGARAWWDRRNARLKAYLARPASEKSAEAARQLYEEDLAAFDEMVAIEAVDARTLRVELESPLAYFLELAGFATFSPVHEASISKFMTGPDARSGRIDYKPEWMAPENVVCNGAYQLAAREPQVDLLLEANPHYWNRAAMGNGSIYMKVVQDQNSANLLYSQGQFDWWPDVIGGSPLAEQLITSQAAGERSDVHAVPSAGTYFYSFNCNAALEDGSPNPLADARVRRALSMAIDRDRLVKEVTRTGQTPALTFTPDVFGRSYSPPVDAGAAYDPEGARALLAEAGYPGGEGLEGLSVLFNTGGGHEPVAEFITRDWKRELNIDVRLEAKQSNPFSEDLKNQRYLIARASWFGDYRDPTTFLAKYLSDGGNNDSKWSNAEFDRLLAEAEQTIDAEARAALLREAEAIMLRECPIVPIYYYVRVHLFDPARVEGILPNAWNARRLEFVKVKPAP